MMAGSGEDVGGEGVLLRGTDGEVGGDCSGGVEGDGVGVGDARDRHDKSQPLPPPTPPPPASSERLWLAEAPGEPRGISWG